MKTYEQQLNHLIELSKSKSWKNYAWARAQELDSDQSGNWSGIANDLKNAMLRYGAERKKNEESND